jgi:biopolymer transport protein ExbD
MAILSRHKRNINFAMSGMTDIVFLLLIFFMLVSTLIVPGVMNVTLPSSNNQTISNPQINVSVTQNREFYVEGEMINPSDLEKTMRALIAQKEEQPVLCN